MSNFSVQVGELKSPFSVHKYSQDRRHHQRVHVNLLGRFMKEDKQEFPCRLLNISPGSAAMLAPMDVDEGENIIAYFDHIGGIEGVVTRTFEGGFAIKLKASLYKKEKLAEQLTWLANRNILDEEEDRRHIRIVPNTSMSKIHLANGASKPCKIIDVSVSGASVALQDPPDLGVELQLGKMKGRVVRHHHHGIGIEFTDIQRPSAIRRHFG